MDTTAWLSEFDNLVITRTFSKIYGMAGLALELDELEAIVKLVANGVGVALATPALQAATRRQAPGPAPRQPRRHTERVSPPSMRMFCPVM